MSRWKAIRCSLVCLVLLLNVSFALSLFAIKKSNDQIRSAYLERVYYIYTYEIYPAIRNTNIQELDDNTSDGIVSFYASLGLNSLYGGNEFRRVSIRGYTSLYEYVDSLVNMMYLIINPDSYTGMIFDYYKGMPEEDLLDSIKRENQEVKDALDEEIGKGKGYIEAFEKIEPFLVKW